MLIYFLWLFLLLRPSYEVLRGMTLVAAALGAGIVVFGWLVTGFEGVTPLTLVYTAIVLIVQWAIFFVVGLLIVFLRLKFALPRSGKDKELDAELARIRAEISARDS